MPPYQQHVGYDYAESTEYLTTTNSKKVEYHVGNILDISIVVSAMQVSSKMPKMHTVDSRLLEPNKYGGHL